MNNADGLSVTDEYASELRNYELLREELLRVEEERDHLVHQASPHLQSVYLSKVGKLKLELLEIRIEVYRLKRKMELIQSCINRQSEIVLEAIDILLEKEIQDQRKKLDEESKKLDEALKFIKLPPMQDKDISELKSIYYKLARKLHPDLNPDQSETMKLLWLKVSDCYNQGDLAQMRVLEVLVSKEQSVDQSPTLLEELKRRNELFAARIKLLMKEIDHIKSNFPFTFQQKLNDASWIEKENNESLNAISSTREQKAAYEKLIDELLNENLT